MISALSAVLLWGVVAASGCAPTITLGRDFAAQTVSEIKIGETKMETVLAVLGEPRRRWSLLAPQLIVKAGALPTNSDAAGAGDLWEYYFAVGSISEVKQKMLLIFFDKDRVVQGYLWFSEF